MHELKPGDKKNHWLAGFPEMNPNPVIEMDSQGIITFANTATLNTLKKLGLPLDPAIFVPYDKSEILSLLKDSSEHQVYREINLKDAWFSENIALNHELQVVRIYTSDITDRKRIEEELHRAYERTSSILDSISDSFIALDKEWRFTYINRRSSEYSHKNPKDVLGRTLWEVFPEITGTPLETFYKNAMISKEPLVFTNPSEVAAGEQFELHAYPMKDGLTLFGHNITWRKQAEDALRLSEERFRNIVDATFEGLLIHRDGIITDVNRTLTELIGYQKDEIIGREILGFVDPAYHALMKKGLRTPYEIEVIHHNGTRIPVEVIVKPFTDQDHMIAAVRDITERKRSEESLRKVQMRTARILENIADTFYSLDKQWRFTVVNPAAEAAPFNRPASEMLGKVIWDLYPELTGTRIQQHYFDAAKKHSMEHYVALSPLNDRWYEVFMQGESEGVDVYMRDVTELKRSEEILRVSEEKYRDLFENVQESVAIYRMIYDENGKAVDRIFVDANPKALSQMGDLRREDVIGKAYSEVVSRKFPKDKISIDKHLQSLAAVVQSGIPVTYDTHFGGKYYLTTQYSLHKDLVASSSIEITDRKEAEEALRESEGRYRELVENANSIILRMDKEGKISFFNEYAQKFFGYSRDEIIGIDVKILVPPTDSSSGRSQEEMIAAILTNPDDFGENENENIRKNGERVWISWRNRAIRDSLGNLIGNLAIGQDITKRKKAEDALRTSEQRFRLALKNAPVSVTVQDANLIYLWAYNQSTKESADIPGKMDTDIFTPEDASMLTGLKRKVIETGKEVHEQIWLTVNEKRAYYHMYLEPLRNDTGQITGIGTATVDHTLEKLTDIALRENEKRLREANDLLEAVTDATKVIIAAEDTDFRYTYFNKTYAAIIRRLTGKEIMIGMSMIDLFSDLPGEQRSELDEWGKVLNGQSVNDHITFGDPVTGQTIYNVLHVPLRNAKWEIIGAGEIAFDVTSQVRVEETLRETSQYLSNLIDYANAPIIVWDPKFRITLFNHAFEHLTDRKAKEVIGHHLEMLFPENYLAPAMDLIKKTSKGERWESVEIPILQKKGEIRTVLWNSGTIFGFDGKTIIATIAQGQDITDRKKIEAEYRHKAAEYAEMNVMLNEEIRHRESAETNLKKTLSLLNASLESTADGILVVDRQGMITSYNQNFMNMWNIPDDMVETWDNQTIISYFQSLLKDPDLFLADMKDLLRHLTRESYDVIELKDGRIFERYSKPQKIGKTTVGRVWSFRDITDRRRSEEKLVASLEEKEVLLREIHHRVKNNLQLVTGLLDMTRMRTRDEAITSILTDMMLKIQTMAQIHTRLYESKQFGKIGLTGQFRDQIIALSNIYSRKGHEICCEINTQEIFLPVDQALPCALAVNEILSNSYKHAFKGKKEGSIEISAVQENGEISITVHDNGIGMPTDFDISCANSLGLKLVRTLVQHQLKGSLTINSQGGTETIIEFPIAGTGA